MRAALLATIVVWGAHAEKGHGSIGGMMSPWTYADSSMCMQSYINYPALWISKEGSGIDTGRPSGIMRHNATCKELGYTRQTHDLDDLPAAIKAMYAGVTSWKTPKSQDDHFVAEANKKDDSVASMTSPWTFTQAGSTLCLQSYINYPAILLSVKSSCCPYGIMKHNATCEEMGYTKQTHEFDNLPTVIKDVYFDVTAWRTPNKSSSTSFAADAHKQDVSIGGMMSPWTYADPSMCMQSYINYPALWISMEGSGIDTGRPSGIMRHNATCEELGYTRHTHDLDDLPALIKAMYAGVTTWKTVQAVVV